LVKVDSYFVNRLGGCDTKLFIGKKAWIGGHRDVFSNGWNAKKF